MINTAPLSDARPWSPTQLATHPFHYGFRPFPRGQVRDHARGCDTSRPQCASRLASIPLLPRASKSSLAPIWTCFISLGRLARERPPYSASNEFKAQLQVAPSLSVTHCSTAALSGDTKQCCVVRCRQLPNQAPRSISTIFPL